MQAWFCRVKGCIPRVPSGQALRGVVEQGWGGRGVSPGSGMKAAAVCGWGGDGKHCSLQQLCARARSVPFTDSAYISCKKKKKERENHAEGKFTSQIKNKPQPPAQLFPGICSHAAAASQWPCRWRVVIFWLCFPGDAVAGCLGWGGLLVRVVAARDGTVGGRAELWRALGAGVGLAVFLTPR